MSAHLTRMFPWQELCDLYVLARTYSRKKTDVPIKLKRRLQCFGRVLARTLCEFRDTDRTPDEEMEYLDPTRWGCDSAYYIPFWYIGYLDSLTWGYLELNLILTDPDRIVPLLMPNGRATTCYACSRERTRGDVPDEIADRLKPAFDENDKLKPLTREVIQVLRDSAALVFRCMYVMSGENKLLDEKEAAEHYFRYLSWSETEE